MVAQLVYTKGKTTLTLCHQPITVSSARESDVFEIVNPKSHSPLNIRFNVMAEAGLSNSLIRQLGHVFRQVTSERLKSR